MAASLSGAMAPLAWGAVIHINIGQILGDCSRRQQDFRKESSEALQSVSRQ